MPTYVVERSYLKKEIPDGKYGPAKVIGLTLAANGATMDAEWYTKAATPIPETGAQLEGTVETGEYGSKFKKAQTATFGGGGRSPEDRASIIRQHSQHMSLMAIELALQTNVIEMPKDARGFFELIEKTTTWFVKDAAK